MTCNQAQELLPWLLNGSLEAAERDEVRQHLATCESCREALAATREAWSTFDQHIPSSDLVALAWGESAGIDPALAEAHLASCPQCSAEMELVRMSRRLEEEDNVALFPVVKPKPVTGAAPRTWRAWAIAASLAAVVAASGWIHTAQQLREPARVAQAPSVQSAGEESPALKQKVAQLQSALEKALGEKDKTLADAQSQVAQLKSERDLLAQPHGTDIVMLDAVLRGDSEKEGASIRAGVHSTLLFPAAGATGEGTAEILDEAGKVVRRVKGLNPTQESYSFTLPPGALPAGRYTVRLSGQDPVGSFRVVP